MKVATRARRVAAAWALLPVIAMTGLALDVQGPAYGAATDPQYYDFTTQFGGMTRTANPGGRAAAYGNVRFTNKHHVVINVLQLKDECNGGGGDGLGAELSITFFVYNPDADTVGIDPRALAHNYLACDSAWVQRKGVDYEAWDGFKVEYVKLTLEECVNATNCSTNPRDTASSRNIDNPNVTAPHHT